ncbi:MAG: hypothetical protein EOM14_11465 [Clostridia bacterium]|nr:hypothetical protein [Clostridia bacterium]
MKSDAYWDVFTDTGDPVCWLLSRAFHFRRERTDALGAFDDVIEENQGARSADICFSARTDY